MEIKRVGSQPSGNGSSEWFTGTVRIDPLFQAPEPSRVQGASVTFEPGSRTAWHSHPLGQTLIVTAGCGWAQRWNGPTEEIRPGDIVSFSPGEKHWHGASANHGRNAIDRRFDLNVTISDRLVDCSDDRAPQGTLYLILDPEAAAFVQLNPALDLLQKVHRRLPSTFFRHLAGSLNRWVRVYDYRDAEERVDMLLQWYEGEENADQYELPDVEGCPRHLAIRKRSEGGPALPEAVEDGMFIRQAREKCCAEQSIASRRQPGAPGYLSQEAWSAEE